MTALVSSPGRRLCAILMTVAGLGPVGTAVGQGATATVEVHVQRAADAAVAEGPFPIELRSTTDASLSWSALAQPGKPVLFRFLPPGRYRLLAANVERLFDAVAGDKWTLQVVPATRPAAGAGAGSVDVVGWTRAGYGTRFDDAALRLLPDSGGVSGIIERGDPLVVTERIEGGGAYPEMQRLGASGASWTETSYRLGEADITDPDTTGLPLMYPNLDAFESVSVVTAGQTPDGYGNGTWVTLVPRRPSATWQRSVQVIGSPAAFQSVNVLPSAPSVGRLQSIGSGSFLVSGPLSPRVSMLVAGALGRSSRFEREQTDVLPSHTQNLAAHVVFAATTRDELRVFGEHDGGAFPAAGRARLVDPGLQQHDRFTLLSSTWDHRPPAGLAWSANVTYAHGSSAPALSGEPIVGTVERLRDGPVQEIAGSSSARRDRTYVSWRADPGPVRWFGARHLPQFGVNASWSRVAKDAPGDTLIGELVNGSPARAWQYTTTGAPRAWSGVDLALWGSSQIPVTSRVDINLGVRAAVAAGSRSGQSATHIPWSAVSPNLLGAWRPLGTRRLTLLAGFAKYSSRLPLNYLGFGDPHSLSGTVRGWDDRNHDRVLQQNEVGALMAHVGPCCAGGRLNTISASLRAPYTNEFLLGVHAMLSEHVMVRVGATDRRQYNLIQPVNSASAATNYRVTYVEDPALNMGGPDDDQLLPIFDRVPATLGTDEYILQNVEHNNARDHGVDLVIERAFDGRWGMLAGATAHKSDGFGGNRGYRADENDHGVLGEVFSDANAGTNARGRLFFERGYVVKWSALWQLPYGVRGGAAARYQDGQHFTRVVIAPGLQQGMDAIPALPRGKTRFTYAFTLDTRLEKQLRVSGRGATLLLEVYNLLNTNNEVEEDVTTGPSFRSPTAVQPPRSLRLGVRFAF